MNLQSLVLSSSSSPQFGSQPAHGEDIMTVAAATATATRICPCAGNIKTKLKASMASRPATPVLTSVWACPTPKQIDATTDQDYIASLNRDGRTRESRDADMDDMWHVLAKVLVRLSEH